MNRTSVIGAVGVVLVLAFGCGGGHAAPANDADATDATDGPHPGDGAMPTPCTDGTPFEGVCSGYCSNLAMVCTEANSQFASFAACLDACVAPTWSCGTPGDPSGNTIFCRFSHAMAASASPDVECPQAGPNSASCI